MSVRLGEGTGPLRGVRVVEIAGIGPGPHACMLLADLGADVIRVERPGGSGFGVPPRADLLNRGRPSVVLNLKHPAAVAAVLTLATSADVLVEGMRPGIAERLGIGPEACHALNARLVYGRMTGWGQDGPWARTAGHDLTYLATSGALYGLGQDPSRPHFPSNLVGDFGGGSTYLVVGLLAALLEARVSGRGQVIDAAIVDGAAHLSAMALSMIAADPRSQERSAGPTNGGLPHYDLYETRDGRHLAVAPLEPQFYAELARLLPLPDDAPSPSEGERNDELRALIADRVAARTLAEWAEVFDGTEACAAPVLTYAEAAEHPHLSARGVYVVREPSAGGGLQPAPAPRFSRTPTSLGSPPRRPGQDTRAALTAWGVDDVDGLIAVGAAVPG